ncbi:hypothetical protein PVAND_000901 [Polypedilum vanderplanki]|uniref:Uncharacterized protein n=1 Tax=Polypedilum vanderplanki TaxID=319348 RepID=A0A9J6BLL9_POLVA|nr:hypothetical protein PVAND_000901 [Polypedilum vanderplanki]
MEQKITSYYFNTKYYNEEVYMCIVENQTIDKKSPLKFVDFHGKENNNDVLAVSFRDCNISRIPQGLTKVFPNLKHLIIFNSGLSHVNRESLKEYCGLRSLSLSSNNILFIPGDLLEDMKDLEIFIVSNSKIQFIEPNIFDKLNNLKRVDLTRNMCINKRYDSLNPSLENATLEEIKKELKIKKNSSWKNIIESIKNFYETETDGLRNEIENQNKTTIMLLMQFHSCVLLFPHQKEYQA